MTKAELVTKVAQDSNISKKSAQAAVTAVIKAVQDSLKEEGKIRIDGLGTFLVSNRAARTGVNPRTRTKIDIPATKVPSFRAAKVLKEAVKEVPKKAAKKAK
jgi:DNA-binding protein HU-beta